MVEVQSKAKGKTLSTRRLIVLGTASQVPTRSRNQNGYFLFWDGEGLLFDPGEGTQIQLARFGIAASAITKILITHFHGDHCLGLAGVIQRISLDRVAHPVEIYFPASGRNYYEHLRDAAIYYQAARLVAHPIAEQGMIHAGEQFTLETRPLDHPVETWGYRLKEPDGVALLPDRLREAGIEGPMVRTLLREGAINRGGRMVTLEEVSTPRPGQAFAFVMDTRPCPGALDLAAGADLMVCEATYLSDRIDLAAEYGHMTAAQAAQLARTAGARRLVLGHFSQRYQGNESFREEAAVIHADVLAPAEGEHVEVPKRRRFGTAT
jgi:ribonuclease Z